MLTRRRFGSSPTAKLIRLLVRGRKSCSTTYRAIPDWVKDVKCRIHEFNDRAGGSVVSYSISFLFLFVYVFTTPTLANATEMKWHGALY